MQEVALFLMRNMHVELALRFYVEMEAAKGRLVASWLEAHSISTTFGLILPAYSNETGQEFRSLTGRLFQRYTGRGSEAKPDGRNVSGSWFINVGVYRAGQA